MVAYGPYDGDEYRRSDPGKVPGRSVQFNYLDRWLIAALLNYQIQNQGNHEFN
jgi:hypothetical protein